MSKKKNFRRRRESETKYLVLFELVEHLGRGEDERATKDSSVALHVPVFDVLGGRREVLSGLAERVEEGEKIAATDGATAELGEEDTVGIMVERGVGPELVLEVVHLLLVRLVRNGEELDAFLAHFRMLGMKLKRFIPAQHSAQPPHEQHYRWAFLHQLLPCDARCFSRLLRQRRSQQLL